MRFRRLMCFWQSLRPHFLCRRCDRKFARSPPKPIASVVSANFKKMKRHIFILIFFATILSCGRANNNKKVIKSTVSDSTVNSCSDMRTQAIKDLKAGKYKLFEFGIVSSPDTNSLILKQIKIELISGGCNVTEGIDCYRAIMDKAIREKYHNKIIEYSADGFDRIRFKDEFFNQTDSTLFSENSKIITKHLSALDGLKVGIVVIQLFIDKQGKPVKIKLLKGIDKQTDLILTQKLREETFKAMTIGKVKVNSILTVPINIK